MKSTGKQNGGAILVSLMVILFGGILLSAWIKSRPIGEELIPHQVSYQARLLAEGVLHNGLPSMFPLGYSIQIKENSFVFPEKIIQVNYQNRYLFELKAHGLIPLGGEYTIPLRLWTTESLKGDWRRIEGDFETSCLEDIESGAISNSFTSSWFDSIVLKIESLWDKNYTGSIESGDIWVSKGDFLRDTTLLVEGDVYVASGAKLRNVNVLTKGEFHLESNASFEGTLVSRKGVKLKSNSSFEGWLVLLDPVKADSLTHKSNLEMFDSKTKGWIFALSGNRSYEEDIVPSVLMNSSSQFKGVLFSPYSVQLEGDIEGHVGVHSLACEGSGNCIGSLNLKPLKMGTFWQPQWLGNLDYTEEYMNWKSWVWRRR